MAKKIAPNKNGTHQVISDRQLAPSQLPFFADMADECFFYRHKPDGTLSYFSETVEQVLGYSAQDCCLHFFDHLTDSPINADVNKTIARSLCGQRQGPFEMELYHHDGGVNRLEIIMVPHHNEADELTAIDSVAHDITHWHSSVSGYKRKSILLDQAEDIARMGTWDWNILTDEVRWSPGFVNLLGLHNQTLQPGLAFYGQFLRANDQQNLRQRIVQALKTQQAFECSHRLFLADNQIKYVESRGKPLLDKQGQVIRMIGTIHDITDQIEAQSQLEKAYRLINSSVNEIYIFERDSYRFSFVSEGACRNLGYSQREITQMTPFDLCPVIPKVQIMEMMVPILDGEEEQVVFEISHLRKDGTTYPVEVRLQLMEKVGPAQFVAIVLDISCKIQAQQAARDQAALLHSVIDATQDLIFFKDKQQCYLGCNKAFELYTQFNEQDVLGYTNQQLVLDCLGEDSDSDYQQVIEFGEVHVSQSWVRNIDGDRVLLETTKTPYYNQKGEIEGVVGIIRDLTEYSYIQQELLQQKATYEHDAHYDGLTNLPNRSLFNDRLSQSINKAKRSKEGVAVFFIDLDKFKQINDSLGHDCGDKVLQQVASRLQGSIREMDTIARFGGDEFTALLGSVHNAQSAALVAHKMNLAMQTPIFVDGHTLQLTLSIGIALYPYNGKTAETLLKCADEAMYRVKHEDRNAYAFYGQQVSGDAFERALMEEQLRHALDNDEFSVLYQIQRSLITDRIVGIEAFVRWRHPSKGMILPKLFIPQAEDYGLIQAIDEWVLTTACRQMTQWKKQGLGDVRIAVNLSSKELIRNNLYDNIAQILKKTQCDPNWLELEVTESCFVGDPELARCLLNQFSKLGIQLVIDDFGTGYTSLSNLRKLPISKLKIDQSFIQNISQSDDDASIVQAVIGLAKSLGLEVIAEGVETEQQHQFLLDLACSQAQGYLYGRPISSDKMAVQLNLL